MNISSLQYYQRFGVNPSYAEFNTEVFGAAVNQNDDQLKDEEEFVEDSVAPSTFHKRPSLGKKQKFVQTCPDLSGLVQTCPDLSKLVQICLKLNITCLNLSRFVQICSDLSSLEQTCSDLSDMSSRDQTCPDLSKHVHICSNLSRFCFV